MGYCDDPRMVRVDFFKESGKWYTTEAIQIDNRDYKGTLIHDALKNALDKMYIPEQNRLRLSGMTAVCLEMYHEHSHPIMIRLPEKGRFSDPGNSKDKKPSLFDLEKLFQKDISKIPDEVRHKLNELDEDEIPSGFGYHPEVGWFVLSTSGQGPVLEFAERPEKIDRPE